MAPRNGRSRKGTRTVYAPPAAAREHARLLIVGRGMTLRGELVASRDVQIDGEVEGEVRGGKHQVLVGADGRIRASVHARSVLVRGHVHGDITADDKVEILPSGVVHGNIRAARFVLAAGARFHGDVNRSSRESGPTRPAGVASRSRPGAPAAGLPVWTLVEA